MATRRKKTGAIGPVKAGALHRQMGIRAGKKMTQAEKEKAAHSSNPIERKRGQFALNAEKWAHKGRKKK